MATTKALIEAMKDGDFRDFFREQMKAAVAEAVAEAVAAKDGEIKELREELGSNQGQGK